MPTLINYRAINFTKDCTMIKQAIVLAALISLMSMNMNAHVTKTFLEFDTIKSMCAQIYQMACNDNFQPDLLIGICRGGLIPLGILAGEAMFNNRTILTIDVASYDADDKQDELQVLFPVHFEDYQNCGSVLVIDDLVDSGQTIDYIVSMVKRELPHATVKVATLLYKERSKIIPDYYVQQTNDWIVFPWEV
jgi:hypoxanthine phosphoribosyltransferase